MYIDILFLGIGKGVGIMKKSIILAILVLLVAVPVFCTDISAVGYGSTENEAKSNALNALAQSIFPVLVTNTTTTTSSSTKGSSYSSDSTAKVFGELTLIDYEPVVLSDSEKKKAKFGFKAILRDSSATLKLYSDKANEAKKEIEYNYSNAMAAKPEDKSDYYRKVLSSYADFNNYKMILLKLGHEDSIPVIGIDKTFNILQEEYNSALVQKENYLKGNQGNINNMTTQQVMNLIEQNRQEQAAAKAQRSEALLQQQKLREAELQEQKNQFLNSISTATVSIAGSTFRDFQTMTNDIGNAVFEFNNLCSKYESMISSENRRIDNAIKEESAAIRNRAYRTGQLSNGKPLPEAIAGREEEVNSMIREKESERTEIREFIDTLMRPTIQDNYDLIASMINKLEGTRFSDSVSRKGLNVKYQGYDGGLFSWKLRVTSNYVLGLSVDTELKYSDVTGDSNPNINDDKYLNNVDYYELLLKDGSFWSANDVALEFSVSVAQNGFLLNIDSVVFQTDKGKTTRQRPSQILIPKQLLITDVSNYNWLKTSPAFDKLKKTGASSTATTTTNTTTTTRPGTATTNKATGTDNNTVKKSFSFTETFSMRANAGLSVKLDEKTESGKKDAVTGFLASFDLYYKFGSGFLGLGISPFFWAAGEKFFQMGVDLVGVINFTELLSKVNSKHYSGDVYSDFRIGFSKGGVRFSLLVGYDMGMTFAGGFIFGEDYPYMLMTVGISFGR